MGYMIKLPEMRHQFRSETRLPDSILANPTWGGPSNTVGEDERCWRGDRNDLSNKLISSG
jgi:hypothetical protein